MVIMQMAGQTALSAGGVGSRCVQPEAGVRLLVAWVPAVTEHRDDFSRPGSMLDIL